MGSEGGRDGAINISVQAVPVHMAAANGGSGGVPKLQQQGMERATGEGGEEVTISQNILRIIGEADGDTRVALVTLARAFEDHLATCTHPQPPVPLPQLSLQRFEALRMSATTTAYNRINEIREDRDRTWER